MSELVYGVDTSYANGSPNWSQALRDPRTKFVVARVCYGSDPQFDDGDAFVAAHDACKAAERPFLPYLFWLAADDPVAQAKHFLDASDGRDGGRAPVIDVEEESGGESGDGWGSVEQNIERLGDCLFTIQSKLGQAIIYTNADTWATRFGNTDAFSGHRLYLAAYSIKPGEAQPIQGFKELVIHQFSDGNQGESPIAGLSTSTNNVDRDVLMVPDFAALNRR